MVRPLQLRIIPSERHPPRKERAMKVDVKVIKDMTEMHQFVYNMYIKIVQNINNAEAKKNVPMLKEAPKPDADITPSEQKVVMIKNELEEEAEGEEEPPSKVLKTSSAEPLEEGELNEDGSVPAATSSSVDEKASAEEEMDTDEAPKSEDQAPAEEVPPPVLEEGELPEEQKPSTSS